MIERHTFVIFGGMGDLARRKLIPAFYRLITEGGLADHCVLIGTGRRDVSDRAYGEWTREALTDHGLADGDLEAWCDTSVFYQRVGKGQEGFADISRRIETIESEFNLPGNRVFYLALPPAAFPAAIAGLGEASLNTSPGWTRLVIEKPFGRDLDSAHALNRLVGEFFDESQVYRIDHYLGKETVQNLLAFRFANPMFESVWNRDRVESIEITVAEDLGIGSRAGYYDTTGVLRDMVQNHLTQVLTLVAMEPPVSFDADHIRNEKVKVVEAIAPIRPDDLVLGQYLAGTIGGEAVTGYRDENGVAADSATPTFAGLKLNVDTWRWRGVPFYLRTGKRLPRRVTEVAITFQLPPLCLFHGREDSCIVQPNVLLITLQPDEGFTLQFNVKAPGDTMAHHSQALRFSHDDVYGRLPDAYQALILDIIEGDQTLFVRADEVESSWRLYDPVLESSRETHPYAAGTWGPAEVNERLALSDSSWTIR